MGLSSLWSAKKKLSAFYLHDVEPVLFVSEPLLTDDDAVHRNVSIRYYKIKIIPPVSLLQTLFCSTTFMQLFCKCASSYRLKSKLTRMFLTKARRRPRTRLFKIVNASLLLLVFRFREVHDCQCLEIILDSTRGPSLRISSKRL